MSASRILVLLCAAAVCSGTAAADVVSALPIAGQSVPNIAADAETQADFADGFVTLQDQRVMITMIREELGDATFTLPGGGTWTMVVLLQPEEMPGHLQVIKPVEFSVIDTCHVSLPMLLDDAVAAEHAVGAAFVEFAGEAGAAVPIADELVEFWTTDDVTLLVSETAQGACFWIGDVKVCYYYGERTDGSKCLRVFVYFRDENGQWTRVLKLDTGWVEPATANSVVAVGPFNNPLEAFDAIITVMKADLLDSAPEARDLWDSIEGPARAQFQALVESGAVSWPGDDE